MDLVRIATMVAARKSLREEWDEWPQFDLPDGMAPCPFPGSKIQDLMYHGVRVRGVTKLRRPREGVWMAKTPGWVDDLYTDDGRGEVKRCWVDVKNPYFPTDEENDAYYGEMGIIGDFFDDLQSRGYDAYIQGGESGSVAVFDSVTIVDAETGKEL